MHPKETLSFRWIRFRLTTSRMTNEESQRMTWGWIPTDAGLAGAMDRLESPTEISNSFFPHHDIERELST
jgi:hypothetical protein